MEFFCMVRARTLHCHAHAIVLFLGRNPKRFLHLCVGHDRGIGTAGLTRAHHTARARAHTHTHAHADICRSEQRRGALPCQSLSEAGSGVEHPSAAASGKELHNLGQGCWEHQRLQEGPEEKPPGQRAAHRPAWILTSNPGCVLFSTERLRGHTLLTPAHVHGCEEQNSDVCTAQRCLLQ